MDIKSVKDLIEKLVKEIDELEVDHAKKTSEEQKIASHGNTVNCSFSPAQHNRISHVGRKRRELRHLEETLAELEASAKS